MRGRPRHVVTFVLRRTARYSILHTGSEAETYAHSGIRAEPRKEAGWPASSFGKATPLLSLPQVLKVQRMLLRNVRVTCTESRVLAKLISADDAPITNERACCPFRQSDLLSCLYGAKRRGTSYLYVSYKLHCIRKRIYICTRVIILCHLCRWS